MTSFRLSFIAAVLAFASVAGAAHDTNFAVRIDCELQTAGMQSLPDLTWIQGQSPVIEARVLRNGRATVADSGTVARMVIGPSGATGATYAVATNWLAAGTNAATSYWIGWGIVGTNSAPTNSDTAVAWFYTLFFEKSGYRYWSGSGNLYIEKSTATGNELTWLNPTSLASVAWSQVYGSPTSNTALVEYISAEAGADATARTNNELTSNYFAGVTATLTTGKLDAATAATTYQPAGSYATGTPVYAESDPAWAAASNGYVRTAHVGTVTLTGGQLGVGTATPSNLFPLSAYSLGYSPSVGVHVAEGKGIFLEQPAMPITASATSFPAKIGLGWGFRSDGRGSFWLSPYSYLSGGTVYDNAADIYFSTGATNGVMADSNIAWSTSSRPTVPRGGGAHDNDGQWGIFEGEGRGNPGIGGMRFAVYPDNGVVAGPVFIGTKATTNTPAWGPTLIIEDPYNGPEIKITDGSSSTATVTLASGGQLKFSSNVLIRGNADVGNIVASDVSLRGWLTVRGARVLRESTLEAARWGEEDDYESGITLPYSFTTGTQAAVTFTNSMGHTRFIMATTNAAGSSAGELQFYSGDSETSFYKFTPSCDGNLETNDYPYIAPGEVVRIVYSEFPVINGELPPTITALDFYTMADTTTVGVAISTKNQKITGDSPTQYDQVSTKQYTDDGDTAALNLALGEVYERTTNTDLNGYALIASPRVRQVTTGDSNGTWAVQYSGHDKFKMTGGLPVYPEITGALVGANGTNTLYVSAATSATFAVQTSSNLIDWTASDTGAVVSATFLDAYTAAVVVTNSTGDSLYYRVADVTPGNEETAFDLDGNLRIIGALTLNGTNILDMISVGGISSSTATGIAQTVATSYGFAPTSSVQSIAQTVIDAQTAETYPQTIALADGYATVWSTGKWMQAYTAIGASTIRVMRADASLTNAASIVFHFVCGTNFITWATNGTLSGWSATGIFTNGATNTAFIDWQPGATQAFWRLVH